MNKLSPEVIERLNEKIDRVTIAIQNDPNALLSAISTVSLLMVMQDMEVDGEIHASVRTCMEEVYVLMGEFNKNLKNGIC